MFPISSKLILPVKYKFHERKDFNQEEVMIPKLGFDSLEFLITFFERKIFDCTPIKEFEDFTNLMERLNFEKIPRKSFLSDFLQYTRR